jgi:hypothetical protein
VLDVPNEKLFGAPGPVEPEVLKENPPEAPNAGELETLNADPVLVNGFGRLDDNPNPLNDPIVCPKEPAMSCITVTNKRKISW